MASTTTSLYAKIGGKAALKSIAENFCAGLQADELLAPVAAGIDAEQHLAFLTLALGGASGDRGSDALQAHAGLGLRPDQHQRLDLQLRTSLLDNGVPPQEAAEVVAAVASLRHGIAP